MNLQFILTGFQVWEIESLHTGLVIGNIAWHPGWLRFAFEPFGCKLDTGAMREIVRFIEEQEQIRKQG